MISRKFRTLAVLAALPLIGTIALAGCGSSSADSEKKTDTSAPLYDKLPAKIKDAGTIQLGSSVDYPPFEYYEEDGKTLAGFEVELSKLLEKQLGVNFKWNNASFDTLLPALGTGRYDVVYGTTNDTAEREKSYDMVFYAKSWQGFVSKAGNPANIKSVDDMCGTSIAAVRGGIQQHYMDDKAKECVKNGKKNIKVLALEGNAEEQLAVRQGKADALIENYPSARNFAEKSDGKLEVIEGMEAMPTFVAMVLPKSSKQLRDTLVEAWQAIIDDGSYKKILSKWKLGDLAIDKAGVNAIESDVKP